MQICLFRAFPDSYRRSMQIYADQLLARIAPLLNGMEQMSACELADAHVTPRWRRHWDQYVRYQQYTRSVHGDVNHIVDHGYGHLVRSLPANRTVVTFHDAAVIELRDVGAGTRISFRHSLSAIRHAAFVIAASSSARHDFLTLVDYPEARVKVVHLGVDPAFRVLPNREALRRQNGVTRHSILHVGHTQPNMNIETVLRAFARLTTRVEVQLLKVGEPFTHAQQRLIDELGLGSRITHFGRVPFARLPDLYNCADVFWYPARYPGFGLPPLEAMACGTPVICSNRGSLPEIAGDAAMVVDPDDDEGLAARTAALLNDVADYNRFRAAGLAHVSRYDWNQTARETLAIYRQIGRA